MVVFSNEHFFINVSEKDIFKKIAIVELAPMNAVLCKFAQELIEEIPSYFWSVGASSTGKHHPEFSNGDGGLARHSLMAYRWLKNMIETNPSDIDDLAPSMIIASLFHDCCKRGNQDNPSEHTLHEHPIIGAKFILDKAEKFLSENMDFIDTTPEDEDSFKHEIGMVVACVESHMGKWNTSKYSDVVLPIPSNPIQYMVHLADCISSKKYTSFDYEYFADLMSK